MNNNEQKLDMNYMMMKIDEIIEQGKDLHKLDMQSIIVLEETNRRIIDFLQVILDRISPKVDTLPNKH